jgi:hypothetical protein
MIDSEMVRLKELAVGKHWVNDPEQLLYCCLANIEPKNSHLVEFERPLSPSYVEAAKLLYQVVGQSDAEELKSPQGYDMAGERICGACLAYLQTVLAPDEFASFKAETPTRKFKGIVEEIFAMFEEA